MARYLHGTLSAELEGEIADIARADADKAISEGATAPWGDGETLPNVSDLLYFRGLSRALVRAIREQPSTVAACYDRDFRDRIDAEAPSGGAETLTRYKGSTGLTVDVRTVADLVKLTLDGMVYGLTRDEARRLSRALEVAVRVAEKVQRSMPMVEGESTGKG